jgi:hypothetical protein
VCGWTASTVLPAKLPPIIPIESCNSVRRFIIFITKKSPTSGAIRISGDTLVDNGSHSIELTFPAILTNTDDFNDLSWN